MPRVQFVKGHKHLILIYLCLSALSLTAFIVAVSLIISRALNSEEHEFIEYANNQYLHAISTMQKQNAILNGITAYLDTQESLVTESLSIYSQKILRRHPEVYQIQFAHFFPGEELEQHQKHYQSQKSGFQIKVFDPNQGLIVPSEIQPWYVPIVFAASRSNSTLDQTGLDLQSIPFIYEAVESSLKQEDSSVLSIPFENFEGDRVVVMLQQSEGKGDSNSVFFSFLIIDTKILWNSEGGKVKPSMAQIYLGDKATEDTLLVKYGKHAADGESLFPVLSYKQSFNLGEQRVTLALTYRAGLEFADYLLLSIFLIFFIVLLSVFYLIFSEQVRIEKLKVQQSQELYQLANRDTLTGLANRHFFFNALNHALSLASRQADRHVWLLYLDLDGFKAVNDNIGHDAGDEVLRMVSDVLRETMRQGDITARVGGDEFTMLIESGVTHQQLFPLLKRIRKSIQAIDRYNDVPISLGVSIGVAGYPEDGQTITQLMKSADQRMYLNKRLQKEGAIFTNEVTERDFELSAHRLSTV